MKKYILLLILPLWLIGSKATAQASLGIGQFSYYIGNDTLPAYSTDSVSLWIINTGTGTFNDTLELWTIVQDSALFTYHMVDNVSLGNVTIPAGDSISYTLVPYYAIAPALYHYDINVIVIWPMANSVPTSDSLTYTQVLTLPNGIHEIDLQQLIKAYPNPSMNDFTISNDSKTSIEEVRIYDPQGRLIAIVKGQNIIHTQNWKPGTYVMKILLENKKQVTIRVVKQK
ncbi:MAG TPA: T9SS type A sorting domain-containing protein [Bacteroidia bacterium]|jgi:hypothetical protein